MSSPSASSWSPHRRTPWIALAATLLLVVFLEVRRAPPSPVPVDAPPDIFSAERALETLQRVFAGDGEIVSHPTGTPEARAVRQRLVEELGALGIAEVEVQSVLACRSSDRVSAAGCAPVENVVARVPGSEPDAPAIVLMSHYDSVAAGPGVSDDAVGVAALLETTRALLAGSGESGPALRHPLVLLFTDAEEVGLFGARGFVDDHPLARRSSGESGIAVVLNVEARGTTGQSLLFQTSEDDAWLLDAYRRTARPATSSLYAEIYRRLPNDTDLTVFLESGFAGMNFAYAEGLPRYHTPRDDLQHLNRGSLQHHGENLLSTVRTLDERDDLAAPPAGRAVYTDVAGLFVLSYPVAWGLPLAVLFFVGALAVGVVSVRRGLARVGRILVGLGSLVLFLPVAAGAAWLLGLAVESLAGSARPGWAHPLPLRTALWSLVFLVAFAVAGGIRRMARRKGAGPTAWDLAVAAWLLLGVFAVASAAALPGLGIFFLLPLAVAVLCGSAALALRRALPHDGAILAGALATAFFFFQIARFVELGLGLHQAALVAVPLALAAVAYAPLAATRDGRLPLLVLAALLVGGAAGALVVTPYSAENPQGVNVIHYLAGGEARLFVDSGADPPPAALFAAAREQGAELGEEAVDAPWGLRIGRAHVAELGDVGFARGAAAASPVEVLSVDDDVVRLRIREEASFDWLRLLLPAATGAEAVRLGDREMALDPDAPYRERHVFSCASRACAGLELDFDLGATKDAAGEPFALEVYAVGYARTTGDLPPAARAVAEARPTWAVPVHRGDVRARGFTVPLVATAPDDGKLDAVAPAGVSRETP